MLSALISIELVRELTSSNAVEVQLSLEHLGRYLLRPVLFGWLWVEVGHIELLEHAPGFDPVAIQVRYRVLVDFQLEH